MYKLFGSSVPSTYVSTVAQLRVGWARRAADPGLEYAPGASAMCECGHVKVKGAEGCPRCLSIDSLPANTQGMILAALADQRHMTINQLAAATGRVGRVIWRNVKPLVEAGRLRSWLQDQDPYVGKIIEGSPASRFKGRYVQAPTRMFCRVW